MFDLSFFVKRTFYHRDNYCQIFMTLTFFFISGNNMQYYKNTRGYTFIIPAQSYLFLIQNLDKITEGERLFFNWNVRFYKSYFIFGGNDA